MNNLFKDCKTLSHFIVCIRSVRPDIITKNKKEKTCTLIDVAIPKNRNVLQREEEKKLKYKSLCMEMQ